MSNASASAPVPRTGRARCLARHASGAALPVALMLTSMVSAAAIASFDAAIMGARRASNFEEALHSMQAAHVALELCLQEHEAGRAPLLLPSRAGAMRWQERDPFADAAAFAPLPNWPGGRRPPQCLIEGLRIARRPLARGYVVTARGFGASVDAQAWAQVFVVREAGTESRHWRRIARRR
ncbi:hypothetical protein GWC77_07575 [Paraburkholderia sp. NMBU_R16]|uniref:hypothetical protein n=1 Tax=Paraburkholderia sp. NMBU_R16 TaxID=2698676 RepID=UPI0015666280|nr:hypothetical protein [Paraburkholderia sp. NMBU_R16]NRO95795.1 hypothetical protein [Paraburkholderia sp. NMBU_R16]